MGTVRSDARVRGYSVLGLALIAVTLATGCGSGAGSARPSVVLVTVDTLRADHLGAYGYGLETSPNLDRLAAEGVRFEDCTPSWPKTWPSVASLMTGAPPRSTGMRILHRRLPQSYPLLAQLFRGEGYDTAAVVANFNVGRTLGFDAGFDHFVESWRERWEREHGAVQYRNAPGRVKEYTDAGLVTDQALAWSGRREGGRPFFLWVHYMDPHGPYAPPEEYAKYFQGKHVKDPVPVEKIPPYQLRRGPDGNPVRDLGEYRAAYDREIRYMDSHLGRLLEGLRAGAGGENLLVVVTADHGESLGEHEYYLEHGKFSYQVNAHVPLVMHWPRELEAGRVVRSPVGVVDVSRTLLALVGIDAPATFEGQPLDGLARGSSDARSPAYVFMESGYHPEATQRTVRKGPWKLIQVRSAADRAEMKGGEFELYDLARDPGEENDLASRHPEMVAELRIALEHWFAGGPVPAEGEAIDLDTLSPEAREMLRALGYVE